MVSDRLLPVEVQPAPLPTFQLTPKKDLCQRAVISQVTREPFEARVVP